MGIGYKDPEEDGLQLEYDRLQAKFRKSHALNYQCPTPESLKSFLQKNETNGENKQIMTQQIAGNKTHCWELDSRINHYKAEKNFFDEKLTTDHHFSHHYDEEYPSEGLENATERSKLERGEPSIRQTEIQVKDRVEHSRTKSKYNILKEMSTDNPKSSCSRRSKVKGKYSENPKPRTQSAMLNKPSESRQSIKSSVRSAHKSSSCRTQSEESTRIKRKQILKSGEKIKSTKSFSKSSSIQNDPLKNIDESSLKEYEKYGAQLKQLEDLKAEKEKRITLQNWIRFHTEDEQLDDMTKGLEKLAERLNQRQTLRAQSLTKNIERERRNKSPNSDIDPSITDEDSLEYSFHSSSTELCKGDLSDFHIHRLDDDEDNADDNDVKHELNKEWQED